VRSKARKPLNSPSTIAFTNPFLIRSTLFGFILSPYWYPFWFAS
jgi:hypothetical protein